MAVSGIGGGMIDVNGIVSQLMAIEQQPVYKVQDQISGVSTKISTWGGLKSKMAELSSAAFDLSSSTAWKSSKATSGNEEVVMATSKDTAAIGRYEVQVQALARSHTYASRVVNTDEKFSAGTLTLRSGTPATDKAVQIADGASLDDVRDAINLAAGGAAASIVQTQGGRRLVLTAAKSGAENAFTVQAATTGTGGTALGVFATGTDPNGATPAGGMTRSQAGSDARYQINGLDLTSASNSIEDAVDGVSLELRKVTTEPVAISVQADQEAFRKKIDSFVEKYNGLFTEINKLTDFDPISKTGGALQGNVVVSQLRSKLREMVSSQLGNQDTSLASIGIDVGRDGKLSIKESALKDALANPERLKTVLSGLPERPASGAEPARPASGIARLLRDQIEKMIGQEGAVSNATTSLESQRKRLQDKQTAMESRLDTVEKRLRQQYANLDVQLTGMQGALANAAALGLG